MRIGIFFVYTLKMASSHKCLIKNLI